MKKRTVLLLSLLGCAALCGCDDDSGSSKTEDKGPVCGNNQCEIGEDVTSCPADCGTCGNGKCDLHENYASCPEDCKPVCGNAFCEKSAGENHDNCPDDCPTDVECGDFRCDEGENYETCPGDCPRTMNCGNDVCEVGQGETRLNCPEDCSVALYGCGDGVCEWDYGEEYICKQDCGGDVVEYKSVCGDGNCDEGEACPKDCSGNQIDPLDSVNDFYALPESTYRFINDYELIVNPSSAVNGEDADAAHNRKMADFFAFPYPSDLRTDDYGHPQIRNYPLPQSQILDSFATILSKFNTLLPSLLERIEMEYAGFASLGGVYFRTSVPIERLSVPKPEDTMSPDSCYQLINVEKGSSHYKERVPVYVTYHPMASKAWAPNTLVMRPVPGLAPHPGDRYVAVIGDCLKSNGRKLSQSNKLRYILGNAAPYEIQKKLNYYVDAVNELAKSGELGMKVSDIRAFTGYRVGDPAAEMDQMAADLKGKGHVVVDENGVAVGGYSELTVNNWSAKSMNAYIFNGKFKTVNYINGTYPYAGSGDGIMEFGPTGKLKSVGKEETVNFSISIPRTPMPEKGYPIIVYAHGTGGDASSHCGYQYDEGLWLTSNNVPVAMIGYDACMQGNRAGGGSQTTTGDLVAAVLNDPIVIRESWRQTVLDALVIYDLLNRGELKLPPLPDSSDSRNVIFDPSYGLYMGHSQGSQEAGMLLGLTGDIKSAFISAGGAGILQAFVELHPDLSKVPVIGSMLNGKSVAGILGYILGMNDGEISYDTFLTTQVVQQLVGSLEPLNYAHRYIKEPLDGWPSKNIAQSIGLGDQNTPQTLQFTFGAAMGIPTVGQAFVVNDTMRLLGFGTPVSSPQSSNITVGSNKVTGGSMQFKYTGKSNPHFVIYHMPAARSTYLNFFRSILNGTPQIKIDGPQTGNDSSY